MYGFFIAFLLIFGCASCSHCPVYLTVKNSLTLDASRLTINWDKDCENPPHKLRAFNNNPYLQEAPVILEISPKAHKLHHFVTNFKLSDLKYPKKWTNHRQQINDDEQPPQSNCLNFYVLSFNKTNHVTNFECLKINPQWMSETKEIWKFPLKLLLIPGTKCSACYMTRSNSKRRNLRRNNFKQNFNVWQQLVFGVRYLEFSMGYFRSFHGVLDIKGRFFAFSQNQEISSIFSILEDVRHFVEISKEIVILDFNHFVYGFHDSTHELFINLLQDTLEDVAMVNNATKSFDLTIEKMKNAGKYLLILYNHKDVIDDGDSTGK